MTKETHQPGDLLVNDYPVATRSEVLASGQNLKRGAVLGRVTEGRKLKLSVKEAQDGSQVPVAVLAVNCDASEADTNTAAYHSAGLDASKLIFGEGHDADSAEAAFSDAGRALFVKHLK